MKILVLDRNREDRLLAKKALPEDEVFTLSSSYEAIAFAKSHKFDLALIAVDALSFVDSVFTLNALQRVHTSDFIAVGITSAQEFALIERLNSNVFSGFLTKPIQSARLTEIIHAAVYQQAHSVVAK